MVEVLGGRRKIPTCRSGRTIVTHTLTVSIITHSHTGSIITHTHRICPGTTTNVCAAGWVPFPLSQLHNEPTTIAGAAGTKVTANHPRRNAEHYHQGRRRGEWEHSPLPPVAHNDDDQSPATERRRRVYLPPRHTIQQQQPPRVFSPSSGSAWVCTTMSASPSASAFAVRSRISTIVHKCK